MPLATSTRRFPVTTRKNTVAAPKVPTGVREAYLAWLRATSRMTKPQTQALRRELKAAFRQELRDAKKAPAEQKPNGKVAP